MAGSTKKTQNDKRTRIIDAAIQVIAEKSYHLARISDIAKVASVADGTIYLYFKNKEAILLTIFEEKMVRKSSDLKKKQFGLYNCPKTLPRWSANRATLHNLF